MEDQGFSERGTSLALSLPVHGRNKAAFLLSLSKQPTSTDQIGNLSRDTKCPNL